MPCSLLSLSLLCLSFKRPFFMHLYSSSSPSPCNRVAIRHSFWLPSTIVSLLWTSLFRRAQTRKPRTKYVQITHTNTCDTHKTIAKELLTSTWTPKRASEYRFKHRCVLVASSFHVYSSVHPCSASVYAPVLTNENNVTHYNTCALAALGRQKRAGFRSGQRAHWSDGTASAINWAMKQKRKRGKEWDNEREKEVHIGRFKVAFCWSLFHLLSFERDCYAYACKQARARAFRYTREGILIYYLRHKTQMGSVRFNIKPPPFPSPELFVFGYKLIGRSPWALGSMAS